MTKTINKKIQCYCGSKNEFEHCCLPFLNLTNTPKNPEQLMRSRFSAYVTKNIQYIYDTYAQETQQLQSISEISNWADECTWLALKVHHCSDTIDKQAFVEFSVYFIINNKSHEMREKSRFIKEEANRRYLWRYIDGDIVEDIELANIKRNETCPCNHYSTSFTVIKNKKFKHCCSR